jgi:hypothetical protein
MVAAGVVFVIRSAPSFSIGGALAAVLVCTALGVVAAQSTATGPALIAALAVLCFIPTAFVNITEAVLFNIVPVTAAPIALVRELVVAVVAATAVGAAVGRLGVTVFPPRELAPATLSVVSLLWRLAAAAAVFVVCYFAVGAIIYPWVKAYYASRVIPPVASVASMQVLRGVALIAAMYPAIRAIPSRRTARWVFAGVLPVLGAIVPLLPENPLLPFAVRAVHAVEIATYYALYGALIATWFGVRGRTSETATSVVTA